MDAHDAIRWLCEHVATLEEKADLIMAAQDDINAAIAQIQATQALEANAVEALGTDVTAISAALAAGGGTPVDTSALVTAVASQAASDSALVDAVNAVTALIPGAAPAPAPPFPGT